MHKNHLEALLNHLDGIYIEPVAGSIDPVFICNQLVFVCNWLVFACNGPATSLFLSAIGLQQARSSQQPACFCLQSACNRLD